jgi:hypothetical protein
MSLGAAKAVYDSAWQHPGVAWIAGLPLLGVAVLALLRRRRLGDADPRRRAFVLCFLTLEVAILVDAWLTGVLSPLAGGAATAAAVLFVILGDLRFFYLVERQRGEAAPTARAAARALTVALPVSLIVPIGTAVLTRVDPTTYRGNRLFLCYELALFVIVVVFTLLRRPGRRDGADGRARYVHRLLCFELVQYGLWAVADVLIVYSELQIGWWLRIVPNALYYVAFVPVATWATPSGAQT